MNYIKSLNESLDKKLFENFMTYQEWWGQVDEDPYEFAMDYNLDCRKIKTSADETLYEFSGDSKDFKKAQDSGYFYSMNESFKEALKEVVHRINEAPMSDEDKRESDILRNLYKKIDGKKYSKLTPEEQEVLDKYGLDAWGFRGDTKMITPKGNDVIKNGELGREVNGWRGKYWEDNKNADKINFADRARKTDSRDWGRNYADRSFYRADYVNKMAQQKEREDQARQMRRPYNELETAKHYYNSSKNDLDNYYTNMADSIKRADDVYEKEVAKNNREAENSLNYYDRSKKDAQNTINSLLDKHRKKIQDCLESLNEASMSDEDRADSDLLKSILNKIDNRSNAALTPEEKAVLQKYNLTRTNKGFEKDNNYFSNDSLTLQRSGISKPEYNLADKVRKVSDRDYAKKVRDYRSYGRNKFQDMERAKDKDEMGRDVDLMKGALDSRKYSSKQYDKTQADLKDKNAKAAATRDSVINRVTSQDRLNALKDKHAKNKSKLDDVRKKYGLPIRDSFNEAYDDSHMTRIISTEGDSKINAAIIASVLGQLSDGIWENSPGMEGYWTTANEDDQGNIVVDDRNVIYGGYKDRPYDNKYAKMSDDEVRKYFVNKAKYIAQLYMHDNNINPYKGWREDNEDTCDYMSGYSYLDHDPTIGEIFEFVKNNK